MKTFRADHRRAHRLSWSSDIFAAHVLMETASDFMKTYFPDLNTKLPRGHDGRGEKSRISCPGLAADNFKWRELSIDVTSRQNSPKFSTKLSRRTHPKNGPRPRRSHLGL